MEKNHFINGLKMLLSAVFVLSVVEQGHSMSLHTAAYFGKVDAIMNMIIGGAYVDVNKRDFCTGNAPLHRAALQGHLNVVKLLVGVGANIKVRNLFGDTALDIAKKTGKENVAEFLISEMLRY
ncbi:MAG: ankyrin repeat domain-containing protein [Holosporaceae bacterium]|jgi:ankyrin repeat protein|nr:ankyrin repeat domain-containing protein [Holosporaceae bacterium]